MATAQMPKPGEICLIGLYAGVFMPIKTRSRNEILAAVILICVGCVSAADKPAPPTQPAADDVKWQSLFDGKTLGKWKATDFGGQGESVVENGNLLLTHGEPLTGVTWQGAPPATMNYEIELDAQRVDGSDFFCGLTFPVDKTSASLIVGGWGGAVCGISRIDENDAARNGTTSVHELKTGQRYHPRLRLSPWKIQAWTRDSHH